MLPINKKNNVKIYFILFLGLWVLSYFIYPAWLIDSSARLRTVVFFIFIIYFWLNGFLLYRWLKRYLDKNSLSQDRISALGIIRNHRLLIGTFIAYTLLQIFPMTFPIQTLGDEGYHACAGLLLIGKIYSLIPKTVIVLLKPIIMFIILIFVIVCIFKIKHIFFERFIQKINRFIFNRYFLYICGGILIIEFIVLGSLEFNPAVFRFPPISRIIYGSIIFLFGVNEFILRSVQLIFSLCASVYLFRLVRLYRDKETAFICSSLFLFFPATFYFAHTALLTSGEMFFLLSCSFYFLRYLKLKNKNDLILTAFIISLGSLYKQPLIFILVLFGIFITIDFISQKNKVIRFAEIKFQLSFIWLAIAAVLPWLIIGKFYSPRNYEFTVSNWLSLNKIFSYPMQVPIQVTPLISIMFLLGIVHSLFKKRDTLVLFCMAWLLLWYVFWTSDKYVWDMGGRGAVFFLPAIAVIAGQFFKAMFYGNPESQKIPELFFIILMIYLIFHCPITPGQYSRNYIDDGRYVPFRQALGYIKELISEKDTVLAPQDLGEITFYQKKYNLKTKLIKKSWYDSAKVGPDDLASFCRKERVSYVVIPVEHWLTTYNPIRNIPKQFAFLRLETEIYLSQNNDKRFNVIREFNFADNRVVICKFHEGPDA